MAPTKRDADLPKKIKKEINKRTNGAKPGKTPLKIPMCVFPTKIVNLGKPPKIVRKVTPQRKIELANEVALEQLTKSSDISPKTLPSPLSKVKSSIKIVPGTSSEDKIIKPMPKRKRKSTPKLPEESSSDNTSKANESASKPKRQRKSLLKALESDTPSPTKRKSFKNAFDESVEPSQIKKPGPKSRTTPQVNRTSLTVTQPETPAQEISVKKKIVNTRSVNKDKNGLTRTQQKKVPQLPVPFNEPVKVEVMEPEEMIKTPLIKGQKKTNKRNPAVKITETEKAAKNAKKISKEAPVRKPREKTRPKFVSERLKGIKLKVTRTNKPKDMNAKEMKAAASKLESSLANAARVQTRSNSVNSGKSNLSWTRDISTESSLTSTTTCVTVSSNDFVRFDKKLPFVKVEQNNFNIPKVTENKQLENDSSSSDSSSDSSDSSVSVDLDHGDLDLNLSTSSLTAASPVHEVLDNTLQLCLEMDKLTNVLKNYYAEMCKYMVCDDEESGTFSAILDTMDLEKELVTNCENFNSIIGKTNTDKPITDVVTEKDYMDDTGLDSDETSYAVYRSSPVKNRDIPNISISVPNGAPQKSNDSAQTFNSDNYYTYDDRVCEDDDALSLFAESITGMESSRKSSASNMSAHEPYVPKPIQNANVKAITYQDRYYQPTRIEELPEKTTKQNADSSSISKENDFDSKKAMSLQQDGERLSSFAGVLVVGPETGQANTQWWMPGASLELNPVRSAIYKNYCFFYLAYQCKLVNNCQFPHIYIDENTVKLRITKLSDEQLIAEYCLTVKFISLRRRYGLLFMEECRRRDFTRLLFKIAIELGLSDKALNVNALETTLLHLNKISLNEWEYQLMYRYKGVTLCNALLACISETQNFAQFKQAFVKLASFMLVKKMAIDIETVMKILDRVCILPCEDSIARGVLCLMKNTNPVIFDNDLAKAFEEQLVDIESVREEYLVAKKAALDGLKGGERGGRHASPDTTSLMAPPITFKRSVPVVFNHLFKSPSKPAPKRFPPRTEQWQGGKFPPSLGRLNNLNIARTPIGRPNYRRREPRS